MDAALTRRVLRDAGSLQQDLAQRIVGAARLRLDRLTGDLVGRGTDARLNVDPRFLQLLGGDLHVERLLGRKGEFRSGAFGFRNRYDRRTSVEALLLGDDRIRARCDTRE